MLLALLWGGRSSIEEIARSILAHDESQVEYYEEVTENMVGRVLRRHGFVEKDKAGDLEIETLSITSRPKGKGSL